MGKPAVKRSASKVQEYVLSASVEVRITISNPDVIARCVENKDNWRGMYYKLMIELEARKDLAHTVGLE